MRNIVLVAAAAILLGFATAAVSAGRADQKFIEDAIQGNLAEVQIGQLAQQKAQSDEVKSYGEMLVTDHQANNEKAKQVASELGVSPPNGPTTKQKADYDKLAKLSGTAFDREFAKMMVADHKKDVRKFEREAKKARGPLGDYASETLPTLKKHLQAAEKLPSGSSASR
jgi:putative membrane protein